MSGSTNGIPIILHHTDVATHVPDPLYAGEPAVCVAPTQTKLWVGEGPPTNVNRLLLSTDPGDTPLFGAGGGGGIAEPTTAGNWLRAMNGSGSWVAGLPLTGGSLTGGLAIATSAVGVAEYSVLDQQAPPVTTTTTQYVGIRFSSNVAGRVLAIMVCKSPAMVAGSKAFVIGALPATGGSFTSPVVWNVTLSGVGWQRVDLATPLNVVAGTSYAIRIADLNPHVTSGFFATPYSNGPLTVSSAITGPTNVADTGNYWVDVIFEGPALPSTALDVTGPIILNGVQLTEPSLPGSYLRTNPAGWTPGLPLAGGTVSTADPLGIALTLAAPGGGTALRVSNVAAATTPAVRIDNNANTAIAALSIVTNSIGKGIVCSPGLTGSSGTLLEIARSLTATGTGLWIWSAGGVGGRPVDIDHGGTGDAGIFMMVRATTGILMTAVGDAQNGLQVVGVAGTDCNAINVGDAANGFRVKLNVMTATMYYKNQEVTFGDPDSGGTGYRCLRVPN